MPNVVILMSDEHQFRVAGPYGHSRVRTPHLDRIAADGTVFDAAYTPSPLCAPARSAFMAGLPVHKVGDYNNCRLEWKEFPSFGGVLAGQGVHTVHIGKTDVYAPGASLGFSEYLLGGDRAMPGDTNFSRRPLAIRDEGPSRAKGYGPKDTAFRKDRLVVDAAVDWITDTAPTLGRPFTLSIDIVAPHFPHHVTPELWDEYADAGDLPEHGAEQPTAQHPYAQDLRAHFQTETFSDEDIRGLRRGYLGGVEFVDRQLGRVRAALESAGLLDHTVLVYTSDHGEMLGTFGMWWKCSMYEDSVRVPLIVAGPGFTAGARVATPVTLLDLQATLFAATGAERPVDWWGEPLQTIPVHDPDRVAFAEYHGHGTRSGSFMVRRGPWKLLWHATAPHQLFDLASDPHELNDRYAGEPGIAAELEAELRRLCDPDAESARPCLRARQVGAPRRCGVSQNPDSR